MNREEAKETLLLYREGTSDAEDPQVAEALALAKGDVELGQWLAGHNARQRVLREKFRSITVPEGLMEQIISEHAAAGRSSFLKRNRPMAALAGVALVLLISFFAWQRQPGEEAALTEYQNQMTSVINMGYGMDFTNNDVPSIRNFLKQKDAPADFALTGPLQKAPLAGCSVESWQDKKTSLVCFHTSGGSDASTSDLWLFVVDRKLVRNAPTDSTPQLSQVNKLAIATWTADGKLYLLGRRGDVQDLKKYL